MPEAKFHIKRYDATRDAKGADRYDDFVVPYETSLERVLGSRFNTLANAEGIDEKAAGEFGGWSDTSLMRRTYTHAEQTTEKIHEAQLRGLRAAEQATKLTLFSSSEAKKKGRA